eukprot:g2725.t1
MGAVSEAYHTDLQAVAQSYKGYALDNEWVRGIMFQLIQGLGVGRHAYGLHHNDLLTLSNIRLKQIPHEAIGAKKWLCYELSECVFVIDPPNCRHHTAGKCKDCVDQPKCSAVLDEDGGLAADKLPNDGVDGLRVKLAGFGISALSKKSLEYWKKGYTFMNTNWNDDMEDVAVILCGMLQPKVANFDPKGADLCRQMRDGVYKTSPLLALRHPYFASLRTKDQVSPQKRNMYRYTPGCPAPKKDAMPGDDPFADKDGNGPEKEAGGSASGSGSGSGQPRFKTTDGSPATPLPPPPILPGPDGKCPACKCAAGGAGGKGGDPFNPFPSTSGCSSPGITPAPGDSGSGSDHKAKSTPDLPLIARVSPGTPWIKERRANGDVTVGWSPPSGGVSIVQRYNLEMDGVSVFSGLAGEFKMTNLHPSSCHRFSVSAFISNHWTPLSSTLHVGDCGLHVDEPHLQQTR